ncbi:MAG: preprotein translocase subunit YajC [Eubacterium sp.]|nr:preprotein translocase subunit YajC [Eubacterium sp.]
MGTVGMIIYIVVIIGVFWLIAIRPQKKQEKEHQALIASLAVGDSILTTSGFYGVVIDMPDDNVVIVEFGNNKNCRIPMKKEAIVEVQKAEE